MKKTTVENVINARDAIRLTKKCRKEMQSSNAGLPDFINLSEVEEEPIRQEDFDVDWNVAIEDACKKGIGCTQVWASFIEGKPSLKGLVTKELEKLGYDFYHHSGSLYRIRWM